MKTGATPGTHGTSQYIISLLLFVGNKKSYFMTNSENYSMRTIHSSDLHLPQIKLAIFQNGVYFSGVKIFNNLLSDIKNIFGNFKRFK